MAYNYEWKIRAEDVDYSGQIFTPRLMNCLLRGMQDIYEEIGYPSEWAHKGNISRPVVSVDADYLTPMGLGDVVDVAMTTSLGRTSITFEAIGFVRNKKAFDASMTSVIVDDDDSEPMLIPPDLRDGLCRYERGAE
jgi:4-hydroxybenzoyl-CoA thioesterase